MQDFLFNKMKIGRPTLKKEDRKAKITGMRLRGEERELMEKAAAKRNKKLSEWMRNALVSAALTELMNSTETT